MKVLQVTTHLNIGGIAGYILTLSRALKKRGIECVVASSGGSLEPEFEKSGIRHIVLNIKTKFEFGPKAIGSGIRLAGIAKREGIGLIHGHTRVSQVAASLASAMTGTPYITTCHGYFKKRSRGVFDTWGKRVIAISDAVKAHLEDDLSVEPSRIALIYSGVDPERFSRDLSPEEVKEAKKSLGLQDNPLVGNIGRLSSVKGQSFFVEAMRDIAARRPLTQAIIVGSGEEEASLKCVAISFNIDGVVRFIPADPDTNKYLSIMDVFVFPSIKEGLGIGLLEALAAGKACVATDVGGIGDVVKDGVSGLLVPPADAGAIRDAVAKLLDDSQLRKRMGEEGRRLVREKFSVDVMAEKVAALYGEVIGS